jgi:hypothetical protein
MICIDAILIIIISILEEEWGIKITAQIKKINIKE